MKDLIQEYKDADRLEKERIKSKHKGIKKFFSWVLYFIVFPFKWCWYNLRDFSTLLIFGIVFLVVSSEVWVPYLLGLIFINLRGALWAFGSACWIFWLGPGTPFMVLCISITIVIKGFINKIKFKKSNNNENKEETNT